MAAASRWGEKQTAATTAEEEPLLPNEFISPGEVEIIDPFEAAEDPPFSETKDEQETFAFDLFYARFSVLLDAILTGSAVFITRGWQIYIIALVLPFSAGTGAASKGSILQMLPNSDRVDALSGITLVENIARLSTAAVFGLTYSALAGVGKTRLVFVCNAAVALLGFFALMLSRFPPQNSKRVVH